MRCTYFKLWGLSINEGECPNIHIRWWPLKEFMFYLRTFHHRIIFGPGARREWWGIEKIKGEQ